MTPRQPNDNEIEVIPDAEGTAPEKKNELEQLRERLRASEAERAEYLDGWQRARAELANFRKEEAKRAEEIAKFAAESVLEDLIPVLDSFDLALEHEMPKDVERGVILIRSQLEDILRRRGIEIIHATKGEQFDPGRHESVGEVMSDLADGTVIEELQRGYLLHGKVLRPSRVKISKQKNQ